MKISIILKITLFCVATVPLYVKCLIPGVIRTPAARLKYAVNLHHTFKKDPFVCKATSLPIDEFIQLWQPNTSSVYPLVYISNELSKHSKYFQFCIDQFKSYELANKKDTLRIEAQEIFAELIQKKQLIEQMPEYKAQQFAKKFWRRALKICGVLATMYVGLPC